MGGMSATAAAAISPALDAELDRPYPLSEATIAGFRRDGFVRLKDVMSKAVLERFEREFTEQVFARNTNHLPMEKRSTYARAFLQVGNLWQHSELVKRFVFCARLGRIAAELMGTRGVRMYHDQALYKEAQGGFTPWHCDQYYWPLANDNSITAWIPLQAVPIEMGPLAFATGSHRYTGGRHLEIGDESEATLARDLADYPLDEQPFALGDISFHAGWTYHHARGNTTGLCRKVMTIIYMDIDMRLAQPVTPGQEGDRKSFGPDLQVGDLMDTPITPVVWEGRAAT
jgi:ectoine hydroxylase-related dioxygenase (phytanoyl-CoA dioxygenase family)